MLQLSSTLARRSIGVLLHPSSLPGSPVCGSFGKPSRTWLHLLSSNGVKVWQFLPLAPVDSMGSPYSSLSSFALNPWFLDAQDLVDDGYIPSKVLAEVPGEKDQKSSSLIDFKLANIRSECLAKYLRFYWPEQSPKTHQTFDAWCDEQFWLDDYVFFVELRRQYQEKPWWEWPHGLSEHNLEILTNWRVNNEEALLEHKLLQWHLDRQWMALRELAEKVSVELFGDLPFYVSRDSADVWSNRQLFSLLPGGELDIQSGVPPDYFSSTGQLWGTPVYKWSIHQKTKFSWWRKRFARQWQQVDMLRLDHFRALESYWAVSGRQKTAEEGEWIPSPGSDLLFLLQDDYQGKLPLIAEDLGIITPEVVHLREQFQLPGMKILQFAFDGDPNNPYLPENIKGENWVVYTGTHDNQTTLGWWNALELAEKEKISIRFRNDIDSPVLQLLEMALATEALLVVVPTQDLLGLDDEARFNTPGTVEGNWSWRMVDFDSDLTNALNFFGERATIWGRC